MTKIVDFDPIQLGALSHYPPQAQNHLHRLILEDWKASGVKLPTYMKLVARYIAPLGISEEWLSKLSHQTMSKMLKAISTPRHEFWACLHLYLNRKYGYQDVTNRYSEDDLFGLAFVRYGGAKAAPNTGQYTHNDMVIDIEAEDGKHFAYATATHIENGKAPDDFSLDVEHNLKGIAIQQEHKILTILRDTVTQAITMQEVEV